MIGWREWVGLPGLGIARIKAKIETGALTSTLHAFEIEEFDFQGKPFVRFKIHPFQKDNDFVADGIAEIIDKRNVPSTGGHSPERWLIETDVHMGDQVWPVELNLAIGDQKKFRMVLGRNAIIGRAIVDPAASFLLGKNWKQPGQGGS